MHNDSPRTLRAVPSWPEYFLSIAATVASRSKDPNTQVGALLVDSNQHIIGTGYNGMPPGLDEETLWAPRDRKYKFVIHAESNCLAHTTASTRGSTLYCTLSPCAECLKLALAHDVKQIIFKTLRDDPQRDEIMGSAKLSYEIGSHFTRIML